MLKEDISHLEKFYYRSEAITFGSEIVIQWPKNKYNLIYAQGFAIPSIILNNFEEQSQIDRLKDDN